MMSSVARCLLALILYSGLFSTSNCQSLNRTIFVPADAAIGWEVLDLKECAAVDWKDTEVFLAASGDYAHYFRMDESQRSVLTSKSVSELLNRAVTLDIILSKAESSSRKVLRRVFPISVRVIPGEFLFHFERKRYRALISSDIPTLTEFQRISLIGGPRISNFTCESPNKDYDEYFLFSSVRDPNLGNFCRISVKKSLKSLAGKEISFMILGKAHFPYYVTADTELLVVVRRRTKSTPMYFSARRYVGTTTSSVPKGTRIFRVSASCGGNKRRVAYSLGRNTNGLPFAVHSVRGDVYTKGRLNATKYAFEIKAVDPNCSTAFVPVVVFAVDDFSRVRSGRKYLDLIPKSRIKRAYRPPIRLKLPENQKVGMIRERIQVGLNEILKDAPLQTHFLTVYRDGRINLTRNLNFENSEYRTIRLELTVENTQTLGKVFGCASWGYVCM